MSRFPVASVHGRFQPLHNGHLEYLKAALDRSDFLIVGITQHMVRRLVQVDNPDALHRAAPHSNPLGYYERVALVDAVFASLGVTRAEYATTPFPIEEPDQLADFLPISVPILTTTYDRWNAAKIEKLQALGYKVENLWSRDSKQYEGRVVRQLIQDDDPRWQEMIPSAAIPLIQRYDIGGRLRALGTGGG